MWDKPPSEGKIEELVDEIDKDEDPDVEELEYLEFSEDFFNKFCEIRLMS